MNFAVIYMPRAIQKMQGIADWLIERSPAGAEAWNDALLIAVQKIASDPYQYGFAPENNFESLELRQAFFRTQRGKRYRIVFTIEGLKIVILYIRGPGQDLITN